MNSLRKSLVLCALLLTLADSLPFGSRTTLVTRSQTENLAREYAGWEREVHRYEEDGRYWSVFFAPEYARSFHDRELVDFLLDGHDRYPVTGSLVPDRGPNDILADNFCLPPDYQSLLCFHPTVTEFIADFDFFMGFNYSHYVYIKVHAPIVHSKWNLHLVESVFESGTGSWPAGYLAATDIARSAMPATLMDALHGGSTCGDMKEPLQYGKIWGRRTRSHIADMHLSVGIDALHTPEYHLGFEARFVLPTGNGNDPEFFFNPIIGNGHHGEFGIGITSHYQLWSDPERNQSMVGYFEMNVSHFFSHDECRSYELKCHGPGSRYMLMELIRDESTGLDFGITPALNQYASSLEPVINYSTLDSTVSFAVQIDAVLKAAYYRRGFGAELGYNLWYRSKEKLHCRQTFPRGFSPRSDLTGYALKGDAQVYGFTGSDTPVELNATQSKATLFAGNPPSNFELGTEFTNTNADNAAIASGLTQLNAADSAAFAIPQLPVRGSNPAILLSDADIDEDSALMPTVLTNKIFGYVGYTWDYGNFIAPFLGLGLEAEFTACIDGVKGVPSMVGVWVKAGISY